MYFSNSNFQKNETNTYETLFGNTGKFGVDGVVGKFKKKLKFILIN
jgi:hypothetical protein